MAVLRLFASAREAAGRTSDQVDGPTVGAVLDEACRRYGAPFSAVLAISKVWVNGEPADPATSVASCDVVAVLPPVSGGSAPLTGRQDAPADQGPRSVAEPASPPNRARSTSLDSGDRAQLGLAPRPPIVRGNLALVPEPEPDLDPAADDADDADRPPLAVVHQSARPHGRLGLLWAAATVGFTVAGPGWLAGWLALAAMVAATQTAGVWRRRGERPLAVLAAGIAVALPVAASFGSVNAAAINGVIVVGLLLAFVARLVRASPSPLRDMALTLTIAVPIGLAVASVVLLRHAGVLPALLLLAFAAVYDASAYLIGTGANSAWEGPVAGVAALVPLTILAAVVFIPPFSGVEPLVLGLLAAALAPIGPVAGSALLGDASANAPGLRRLDSLLVMGPIWMWVALSFLR